MQGRKSELTQELSLSIRKLYLDGQNYKNIQEILDIKPTTWDRWVHLNYKDFRVNLKNWKKEKIIESAEANLPSLLASEDERIKTVNTWNTLETLAKDEGYTKRTELTGKGGKDLTPDKETQDRVDNTLDKYLDDDKRNTQTG